MNINIEIGNNLKDAICKVGNTETPGKDVQAAFGLHISSLINFLLLSRGEKGLVGKNLVVEIKEEEQ